MKIKIDNRNELFKRQELVLEIESDKNPSFIDVQKKIAEEINKPEENIDVLKVKGGFGKNVFEVEANVYNSKEELNKMIDLRKTKKSRCRKEKGRKNCAC